MTDGIILVDLMLISFDLLIPVLARSIEDGFIRKLVGLGISLAVAAPFLWALMAQRPDNIAYKELWTKRKYNRGPLLIIEILRSAIGIMIISFWVNRFF